MNHAREVNLGFPAIFVFLRKMKFNVIRNYLNCSSHLKLH